MMRDFLTAKEVLTGKSIILEFKEQRNKDIVASDKRMPPAFAFSPTERENFEKVFNFELALRLFRP
jgi:hypothetical protein